MVESTPYTMNNDGQKKKFDKITKMLERIENKPSFKLLKYAVDKNLPENIKENFSRIATNVTKNIRGGIPDDWFWDWENKTETLVWTICYYSMAVWFVLLGMFGIPFGLVTSFLLSIIPCLVCCIIEAGLIIYDEYTTNGCIQMLIDLAFASFGMLGVIMLCVVGLPIALVLWMIGTFLVGALLSFFMEFFCLTSVLNGDTSPP